MPTSDAGLTIEDLRVAYGPIVAVNGVTLTVAPRSLVAIVGSNGAGKSSLLRGVSGLVRPTAGTVRIDGRDLQGCKPHTIIRAGLAHVPEGRRVVAPLSVEENLKLAGAATGRRDSASLASAIADVYDTFPRLSERRKQASGLLSGGEQQMLAIGRGLVANPRVLMMDEPSMGLAPIIVEEIYGLLEERPGAMKDCGILLAEQTALLAMKVADKVHVLRRGEVVMSGAPSDLGADAIEEAYLGTG